MLKETNNTNREESDTLILENTNNYDKITIIENILLNYGYSYNTWKVFFIVFFLLISDGIHLTYFGNLIIPIKNYYNISDHELSIHSSIIFVSFGLGALSAGYISYYFKRIYIIIISQLIIAILHLFIGLSGNIIIFSITRFIIGFLLGIIVPINLSILTEYLPILFRAYILVSVWIGFSIGQCVFPILMLWLMPNMEIAKYPDLIIISSSFSFISFLFSFLFLRDSPRHLILTGQIDEGIKILEELNKECFKEIKKEKIIQEVNSGINNIKLSYKEMFNNEFSLSTILLSLIIFIYLFISFGVFLVFSLTVKELGSVDINNNEIILKQLYVNLINLLSNILGGLLCENSYLGRVKAMIICLIIAIIFLILSIIYVNHFEILFGIFAAVFGISSTITITYVAELYPTKIRDLTLGYIFSCGRVGAFVSQSIFIYLHNSEKWVPYYTAIAFSFINLILHILLPYETYKKPLDFDIQKDKDNK